LSFAAYVKFVVPGLPAPAAASATGLFLLAWTILALLTFPWVSVRDR
jgi:hypothetical protein